MGETLTESRQARALDGIDLDTLTYRKLDGVNKVSPAQDLSGTETKKASTQT